MVNTVDKFEIDLHNANCVVFGPDLDTFCTFLAFFRPNNSYFRNLRNYEVVRFISAFTDYKIWLKIVETFMINKKLSLSAETYPFRTVVFKTSYIA